MAFTQRSSVLAVVKEDTQGQLKQPTSGDDFTVLNDGFSVEGARETVESAELVNDIGASKAFATKEAPTASFPKYFKHSGVEGQAPDYSIMVESAMGKLFLNPVEYATDAGSQAGDSANQAFLQLATGEAANFRVGQALLIKYPSNTHAVRNVDSVDEVNDRLYLSFNLDNAPAAGVNLGKAVFYQVRGTDHPSFSLHHYQAGDATSGFKQSVAGCRTSGMSINFPVNDLASIDFTVDGISYFFDPIELDATSNIIDFIDDGGSKSVTLDVRAYKHPSALADLIAQRMSAVSVNNVSCIYSGSKFVIASDGATFELEFGTAPTGNSAGAKLGFAAADLTGATTYTSDNEQTWGPDFTPVFDDQTPTVVKSNELLIGTYDKAFCRSGNNVSVEISTPKTDVEDFCAESGVSDSVINERTATLTATLIFKKDEVDTFYALLQNSDLSCSFTHGPKTAGNWEPGKCVNVYLQKATITQSTLGETDSFVTIEVTAQGFVTTDKKDCAISFL